MRRTCFHVGAGPRAARIAAEQEPAHRRSAPPVSSGPVVFVGAGREGPIPAEIGLQPVYHFAFVVTRNRVLLGRLRPAVLDASGDLPAEAVMETDPSTVRGDSHLQPLAELMRRRYVISLSVTTPEGELLGSCAATISRPRSRQAALTEDRQEYLDAIATGLTLEQLSAPIEAERQRACSIGSGPRPPPRTSCAGWATSCSTATSRPPAPRAARGRRSARRWV